MHFTTLSSGEPSTDLAAVVQSGGACRSVVYTQRHRTPLNRIAPRRKPITNLPAGPTPHFDDELLRAAFRDVHGSRLHGFALLVTLGDRHVAGDAAGAALAEGTARAHELRHPERAAAWLRARVLRLVRRRRFAAAAAGEPARRRALAALGVDDPMYAALAPLSTAERAALVAANVERLDPVDVETVLATERRDAQRIVRQARERYLRAYLSAADGAASSAEPDDSTSTVLMARNRLVGVLHVPGAEDPGSAPRGELAERVHAVARRALAGGGASR